MSSGRRSLTFAGEESVSLISDAVYFLFLLDLCLLCFQCDNIMLCSFTLLETIMILTSLKYRHLYRQFQISVDVQETQLLPRRLTAAAAFVFSAASAGRQWQSVAGSGCSHIIIPDKTILGLNLIFPLLFPLYSAV